MEKTVSQIHDSLQKLMGLHRQLLDTVRLEREALIGADLKGIQEATCAKEAIIEAIRQAESARLKHVGALALEWKRPFRELTVTNIIIAIQAVDSRGADQLRSAYNALTILMQRIREQNEQNRLLVERSLEHVHNMKRNVLGEAAPRSDTYTPQGQKTNGPPGSRLISREA
jgi:flagellar biosynthesis/type III secretory pathway chaperone